MSIVPFVQGSFPNPHFSEAAIITRLQLHAQFLAAKRRGLEYPVDEYGEPDLFAWRAMLMRIELHGPYGGGSSVALRRSAGVTRSATHSGT